MSSSTVSSWRSKCRDVHEHIVTRIGAVFSRDSLADDETLRPEAFEGLEIPLAKRWG